MAEGLIFSHMFCLDLARARSILFLGYYPHKDEGGGMENKNSSSFHLPSFIISSFVKEVFLVILAAGVHPVPSRTR